MLVYLIHRSKHLSKIIKDTAETLKDLRSDANIGLRSVTNKDAQFKGTQQFIKNLQKEYDIEIITGHSLEVEML